MLEPGQGSAPDAQLDLLSLCRRTLHGPWRRLRRLSAMLHTTVPQNRALSTLPADLRTVRQGDRAGIPITSCESRSAEHQVAGRCSDPRRGSRYSRGGLLSRPAGLFSIHGRTSTIPGGRTRPRHRTRVERPSVLTASIPRTWSRVKVDCVVVLISRPQPDRRL